MQTNTDYWENYLMNQIPESYNIWFKAEKKYLHKHIKRNSRVLEVGCGAGRSIADILDITTNIVGIDHDSQAVAEAKQKFSKYKNIKFMETEADDLPFEDKSFDYVICMTTFANFGKKKYDIINEMKRVLLDNGRIIISVFSQNAFEERMKVYKDSECKIKEIKGTTVVFEDSLVDNVSEQFSRSELEEIFTKANLKIKDVTEVNIAYLCVLSK
ncbi:class I SAM-dependent methyltransferase [Candidatus Woesearchaeota archaeon]|nr:class I SAM-dependent methyltransferase [Candidatus Woesearchaeota archaeon]